MNQSIDNSTCQFFEPFPHLFLQFGDEDDLHGDLDRLDDTV